MIELITVTVRNGGSIFAGDDSVIARLDPFLSAKR
jgi:hypothetical protein